ncbi:MAG: hypothetical protein DRI71_09255 [Bacteroidetes bacterium]|nr:MAG: hypothetical protein DRI71_09255 [Bacteroidota bacterium]
MKNLTTKIAIMLFGLSIILSSCDDNNDINPSSNITRQDRTIIDYSGIEISTAFTVDITFSSTEDKIEIEANENLHALIDVVKSGNNLVIKLKDNTNIHGNTTLKAHIITSNTLEEIFVSGASLLTLNNRLDATNLGISISGASNFNGLLSATSIILNADGASNIELAGSAEQLSINGAGASTIGSYQMNVYDVTCNLSGACQTSLTVIGSIDLTASEASIFMYKGGAQVTNLNLSGASQIIKVN